MPPTAPPDGIDVSSPNIYGSDFRTMARGLTWHHGAAYVTVNPTRHGGREINFVEIQLTTFRNLDIYECCTFFLGGFVWRLYSLRSCFDARRRRHVPATDHGSDVATDSFAPHFGCLVVWLSGLSVCLVVPFR